MHFCDVDRVGRAARRFMHLHFVDPASITSQRAPLVEDGPDPGAAVEQGGLAVRVFSEYITGASGLGDDAGEVVGDRRRTIPSPPGAVTTCLVSAALSGCVALAAQAGVPPRAARCRRRATGTCEELVMSRRRCPRLKRPAIGPSLTLPT